MRIAATGRYLLIPQGEVCSVIRGLRRIQISGPWDEFTAHRIRKETERLYPHARSHPRPRLPLVA